MTILSVFEILLVEVKSVLLPAQSGTASKKVKIKLKNQKAIRIFLKNYLKCDRLIFYLFIYLFIYLFCLTLSVTEKLKTLFLRFQ